MQSLFLSVSSEERFFFHPERFLKKVIQGEGLFLARKHHASGEGGKRGAYISGTRAESQIRELPDMMSALSTGGGRGVMEKRM